MLFLCPSRMQHFRISNEKKRPRGNSHVSSHIWTSPTVPDIHTWPSMRRFLIVCPISTAFNSMTHVHEACWRDALQRAEHAMHRPSMNENNAMRHDRLERAYYSQTSSVYYNRRVLVCRVARLQFIWGVKLKTSFIRNLARFHHPQCPQCWSNIWHCTEVM